MKGVWIFLLALVFLCLFIFQVRHFIKDEGDSLNQAVVRTETIIYGILSGGFWILFALNSLYQ